MQAGPAAVVLIAVGGAFVAIGAYVFRLYRATFRSDFAGSITRDLLSVLALGTWAAPPLLAALMFYLGGISLLLGLFVSWSLLVH